MTTPRVGPRLDWRGVNFGAIFRKRARLGFSPPATPVQPPIKAIDPHAIATASVDAELQSDAAMMPPPPPRQRRRGKKPRAPRLPRLKPLVATEGPSGAAHVSLHGHTYMVLALSEPHHALLGRVTAADTLTAWATFVVVPYALLKIPRAIQMTMTRPYVKVSTGAGAAVAFEARAVGFHRSSGSVTQGQLVLDGPLKNYVCNDAMRAHLKANVTVSDTKSNGAVFAALQRHTRPIDTVIHLHSTRARWKVMDAFGTMKACAPERVQRLVKSERTRARLCPTWKCGIRGTKRLLEFLAAQLQREAANATEVALLLLARGATPLSAPAIHVPQAPAFLLCNGVYARAGVSWTNAGKCRCGVSAVDGPELVWEITRPRCGDTLQRQQRRLVAQRGRRRPQNASALKRSSIVLRSCVRGVQSVPLTWVTLSYERELKPGDCSMASITRLVQTIYLLRSLQ